MSQPFIGEIKMFAGNFAPRNYAYCNGFLLPIAQNTALFSILGTTYGGDGRQTFGLPDLQDRLPMHAGNGPGLTQRRIGQQGGADTATLTTQNMPAHIHPALATNEAPDTASPAGATPAMAPIYEAGGNATAMANEALLPTGGGQAHNNQQPYLRLNFIIALQGLFPSRA